MKIFTNILMLCTGILFLNTSIAMPQLSKPPIVEDKINMEKIKIIHMDPMQLDNVELFAEHGYPFMEVIDGENPKAGGLTSYESTNGKFNIGLSRFSKMTLRLRDWPVDEFMYILEGKVEITDEDGTSKIYGPGDAIIMPKGFNGTWRQLSTIKKINVTHP